MASPMRCERAPCPPAPALAAHPNPERMTISPHRWSGFVGYGSAPSTLFARVLALLETYAIILTIAWLTSILTSELTTQELKVGFGVCGRACLLNGHTIPSKHNRHCQPASTQY